MSATQPDDAPAQEPRRRSRSPQQRKARDYAKQHRNEYGENPEASRKGIRMGKARGNRLVRRTLARDLQRGDDEGIAPVMQRLSAKHFKKIADVPLGEVVETKLARRAQLRQTPVVNPAARARRRRCRSGKGA